MSSRSSPPAGRRRILVASAGGWILAALSACHASPHPAATPRPPSVSQLHRDLDSILAAPALEHGFWGVLVRSLASDEALYSLNEDKLLMPASNMKILTLAAAADRLGWDYRYETRLVASAPIDADAGILVGDLIVVGSGDPSIGDRQGPLTRVFDAWAEQLKHLGLRRVEGRLIGDDRAFDGQRLGAGWAWDDLGEGYAAGVTALQFNENIIRATIAPGLAVGDDAVVTLAPAGGGLAVRNELKTLIEHGIDVRGPAVGVHELTGAPSPAGAIPLATYRSPPLSALATTLMKVSQNLYAETLLRTIGAASGTPTSDAGRASARSVVVGWGVAAGGLIMRDGSGLSRYNYITPLSLVTILTHVDRDEKLRGPFEAALPIAAEDGTLAQRMPDTLAAGNARAKTGSLANVRALSGYVRTADGEQLVFSIIANNFDTAASVIEQTADAIVARLAEFSRR